VDVIRMSPPLLGHGPAGKSPIIAHRIRPSQRRQVLKGEPRPPPTSAHAAPAVSSSAAPSPLLPGLIPCRCTFTTDEAFRQSDRGFSGARGWRSRRCLVETCLVRSASEPAAASRVVTLAGSRPDGMRHRTGRPRSSKPTGPLLLLLLPPGATAARTGA